MLRLDNMRVYAQALDLVTVTHEALARFPAGYGFLSEQLRCPISPKLTTRFHNT